MRDLIIGLGNLRFSDAEPFLASLRYIGYRGDVCLFAYDIDTETAAQYREFGVIVGDGRPYIRPDRNIMNSRFFMILNFLSRHHARYDRVMLSDIRDVIFQADPFASLGTAEVLYGVENSLIRDCPINGAWVMQGYGYGIYENIRDFYISCAGTTLGTTGGILQYLTLMFDEMSTCKVLDTNIDQGIHNYLVHMRPITNSILDKNSQVIVALHHMADARLTVTDRGIELDGAVVPIVHQWDRHASTAQYVRSTPRFRVAAELHNVRIFDGKTNVTWCTPASRRQTRTVVVYFDNRYYAGRLGAFLRALRASGFAGAVMVLGTALADADQAEIRAHGAHAVEIRSDLQTIPPENAAHIAFARHLAEIEGEKVFFFSNPAVQVVGDPFEGAAVGVSLFAEGPKLVLDCQTTTESLQKLGATPNHLFMQQIVSDQLVRGDVEAVRNLYAQINDLFVANPGSHESPGAARAALNILAWVRRDEPLDITVHPNGSCALFERWPAGIEISRGPVLKVGGASPSIIVDDVMGLAPAADIARPST